MRDCFSEADRHGAESAIEYARRQAERAARSTVTDGIDRSVAKRARIGAYRLLGEIHRGAQGVVYHAVHTRTMQAVALKVLGGGPFASPLAQARFQREIETLATLRHPSIVTIHDAGTVHGCVYYAMDYVAGKPLNQFTRDHGSALSTRNLASIFAQIADAVGAAHIRGVMHRDLKPHNILVTADGEPRVLDFGLAKLLGTDGSSVTGKRTLTDSGQFVGTLAYASPEQARGESEAVDTRSDVYALGVVFYEAITGRLPYDVQGPLPNLLRQIEHATPPAPTRVRAPVDDELDAIVLTCLRKEPARRYQNAVDLARDLRRYLDRKPIDAKRESRRYQVRKFIARHRLMLGAASTALVALLVALSLSLTFWSQAAFERDRASLAQAAERQRAGELATALADAEEARTAAEAAAAESDAVQALLYDMLQAANPRVNHGRDVTVRDLVDGAAATLAARDPNENPALDARFNFVLARLYDILGEYRLAGRHYRTAHALWSELLGPSSPHAMNAIKEMLRVLVFDGKYTLAGEELRELERFVDANSHVDPILRARLDLRAGVIFREQGYHDQSEERLTAALRVLRALDPNENSVGAHHCSAANALAIAFQSRGEFEAAVELFDEARALAEAGFGNAQDLISINNNLGVLHYRLGNFAEADERYQAVHAQAVALFGQDHPLPLTVLNNRIIPLIRLRRPAEAVSIAERALAGRRRVLNADHPELATSLNNLGLAYTSAGHLDDAEHAFAEAVAQAGRAYEAGHPRRILALRMHARALIMCERYDEAETQLQRAHEACRTSDRCDARRRARIAETFVLLYETIGDTAAAERWRANPTMLAPPPSAATQPANTP